MNYLSSLNSSFSVIVLTECHFREELINLDIHNMYPLNGYNMFYVRSKIKYGGVIIYVKDNVGASYINELTGTNNVCDSLYIKIPLNKTELVIGGYYRHCISNSSDKILYAITKS